MADERGEFFYKPAVTTDGGFDFTQVDSILARDYKQSNIIQLTRNINPSGSSAQQVKITDGTDTALVDGSGSLQVVSIPQATSCLYNLQSGAGTTTLGTVGAGKRWLIIGWTCNHSYAVGGGRSQLRLNGVNYSSKYTSGTYDNETIPQNFSKEACPILTATQNIQLVVTTNGALEASVYYIEESV